MSLRPAWSTERVPGQEPKLQRTHVLENKIKRHIPDGGLNKTQDIKEWDLFSGKMEPLVRVLAVNSEDLSLGPQNPF